VKSNFGEAAFEKIQDLIKNQKLDLRNIYNKFSSLIIKKNKIVKKS